MKFITYSAGAPLLDWKSALAALREGHQRSRPEQGDLLLGPQEAVLLNRAAFISEMGYVVKAETTLPANVARGMPSIQGIVLLFDADTGSVKAVIESKLVTEFKTAADSVLGAQMLARPDSRHLVIIGAGTVAKSLVRAYSAIFPKLERITVWARRPEQAHALIASANGIEVELRAADTLETAAREADIISSATGARAPVLSGEWVRAGTHVDLIGSFTPEMREADDALMAKAKIYVDFRDTTIDLVGDITQPIAAGVIQRSDVQGDLYDLVSRSAPARNDQSEITVYKNGGGAHLDLMIATYIANVVG